MSKALPVDNDPTVRPQPERVRLRVDLYETLAESRGYEGTTAQAWLHGLDRSGLHRIKTGENTPRLDTALRMAADLGVAVEVLWERVPA